MKLLIGGSPCTHWSIAQTKNRETEASGIGWELFLNYRIARDKYQPDYFLSMYDGMSCGHIALDKLGVEIASYHATEIDKFAIQTTQANFPDVVQLGDAFQVREDGWTYAGLTGGTPEAAE